MCGIAGLFHPLAPATPDGQLIRLMTDAMQHRGPDGEGFHLEPHLGLRAPAPGDRRPGRRRAAHGDAGRRRDGLLQRRDLQPRRPAPGARGRGAPLPHPVRYRKPAAWLARMGHRAARPAGRHVRLRPLGPRAGESCCWRATGWARSRCMSRSCPDGSIAFASELSGMLALPGMAAADRPGGGGELPRPRLHARSGHDLRRHPPPAGRRISCCCAAARPGCPPRAATGRPHPPPWPPARRPRAGRGGAAPPPGRQRARAADVGRAARLLPLRRRRFRCGHRLRHGRPRRRAAGDLHHRLPRRERRAADGGRGRPPPRHHPPRRGRDGRLRRGGARRRPPLRRALRRSFRRADAGGLRHGAAST